MSAVTCGFASTTKLVDREHQEEKQNLYFEKFLSNDTVQDFRKTFKKTVSMKEDF